MVNVNIASGIMTTELRTGTHRWYLYFQAFIRLLKIHCTLFNDEMCINIMQDIYISYEWITLLKLLLGHRLSIFVAEFSDFSIEFAKRHRYGTLYRVMIRMFVQANKV